MNVIFYLNKLLRLVFRFLLFRFRRLPSDFDLKDKRILAASVSVIICGCIFS